MKLWGYLLCAREKTSSWLLWTFFFFFPFADTVKRRQAVAAAFRDHLSVFEVRSACLPRDLLLVSLSRTLCCHSAVRSSGHSRCLVFASEAMSAVVPYQARTGRRISANARERYWTGMLIRA